MIGSYFKTPKGGKLTVVGEFRIKSKKYLEMKCSICSEDKELWSSMKLTVTSFNKGSLCCGCSKTPRYSSSQNKIRVGRYCKENNLDFKGYSDTEVKSKTKVILLCKKGHTHKPTVTSLLNFDTGCGECYLEELKDKRGSCVIPEKEHIKSFLMSRDYPEGTIFDRDSSYVDSQGKCSHWFITCPICREDIFSKKLKSPYKFSGHISGLKAGKVICRCAKNYIYTEEEQLLRIKDSLSKRKLTFEGFVGVYENSFSLLEYSCEKGHSCRVSVNSVVNMVSVSGCQICNSHRYGYCPEKEEEKDYLYVINFDNEYIKVGRSFDPHRRVKELIGTSGTTNIKVLNLYTSSHKNIFEFEQSTHNILEKEGYYHHESTWTIESFHKESSKRVLDFIEGSVLKVVSITDLQNTINKLKEKQ